MTDEIHEIGKELLDIAEHSHRTSNHGVMDELFPYVFQASKRMSLRAICRWLENDKGFKISVTALSKALHQPSKYWTRFVEDLEPSARILARAYDYSWQMILLERGLFEALPSMIPAFSTTDPESSDDECKEAYQIIKERWYSLDDSTLRECGSYVELLETETTKAHDDEKPHRARKSKRTAATGKAG